MSVQNFRSLRSLEWHPHTSRLTAYLYQIFQIQQRRPSQLLQPMKNKSQLLYIVVTALQMFICEIYVPGDILFKITLSIPGRYCDTVTCYVIFSL